MLTDAGPPRLAATLTLFPAGGRFPPGATWIRGQIDGRRAAGPVDVRARCDRAVTYGFCESPVHLDELSGTVFSLRLQPPPGTHRLRLEFFDAARREWDQFFDEVIFSDSGPASERPGPWRAPGTDWLVLALLRDLQARPHLSWRQRANFVATAMSANGLEVKPSPPLHGCLEEPGTRLRMSQRLLSISGWLAHESRVIARVIASIDPCLPAPIDYGAPRTDVAALFPNLRHANDCHFSGEVVVPASQPQPWPLVVSAEFDDGERIVAFVKRVWGPPFAVEITDELPPYSAVRYGCAWMAALAAGQGSARNEWANYRPARRIYRDNAGTTVPKGPVGYQTPVNRPLPRALSVVIVNDNLGLSGAAWFAYEFARFMVEKLHWSVQLMAPEDGPLRAMCDSANIPVTVIEVRGLTAASTASEFADRLAAAAATVNWSGSDVVIVNTMMVAWAVHLARFFGKPSLLYVHESARIARLFPAGLVPVVERACGQATRTVFVTEWTRTYHRRLERHGNFRLLPSWVEVDQVLRLASAQGRAALRRRHGLPENATIVVCMGTICDRKGQRMLVRAVELLAREPVLEAGGGPSFRCLLVGARATPDVSQLRRDIAARGLDDCIDLIDETPHAIEFLSLADIYVCPSFEEGFPRALMEASVLGLHIVSTNVHGIPEMLGETDAWLVPPGDPMALAHALAEAMRAHVSGDRDRPDRARERVRRLFDAARSMPQHAALVAEAASLPVPPVSWRKRRIQAERPCT